MADDKTYDGNVAYLTDLLARPGAPILEGFTFRNCAIRGPVVIGPQNCNIVNCNFDAPDLDSVFYEIGDGYHIGLVGVVDCTFEGCSFEGVGLAGGQALRSQISV